MITHVFYTFILIDYKFVLMKYFIFKQFVPLQYANFLNPITL